MIDKDQIEFILQIFSGVFWTVTYIDCIRVGIKQKICAMPTFSLMLNFCWEGVQSVGEFVYQAHGEDSLQGYANICWFLFDIGILLTFILYGRKEFSFINNNRIYFYIWVLLSFLCALSLQICVALQYGFVEAAVLTAFPQNLVMSIQFVDLIIKRKSKEGSSLLIAICKCLGTFFPTIVFGMMRFNKMCLATGGFAFIFDIIYIYLYLKLPQRINQIEEELIENN